MPGSGETKLIVYPTIGRIVIYKDWNTLRPAMVTNVHEDNSQKVDLTVFIKSGFAFKEGVEHGDDRYQWDWPKIKK